MPHPAFFVASQRSIEAALKPAKLLEGIRDGGHDGSRSVVQTFGSD
jgi:hypothetical protein